jgi:hypothetical protein
MSAAPLLVVHASAAPYLLNYQPSPPDYLPPSLGTAEEVKAALCRALDDEVVLVWEPDGRGYFGHSGFSAEVDVIPDDDRLVRGFWITTRGGTGLVTALRKMCRPNGWTVFDGEDGRELDLDDEDGVGNLPYDDGTQRGYDPDSFVPLRHGTHTGRPRNSRNTPLSEWVVPVLIGLLAFVAFWAFVMRIAM